MSAPDQIQRLEKAMRSAAPEVALPRLAAALRDEGVSQADLYILFKRFQTESSGADTHHEAIADTMDLIWSGPWARGDALFPSELKLGNECSRTQNLQQRTPITVLSRIISH